MPIKKGGSADVSEALTGLRDLFTNHLAGFGVEVRWWKRTADVSDADDDSIAEAYGDRDYTGDVDPIDTPFDPAVFGEQPPVRLLTELPIDITPRLAADILGGTEVVYGPIDTGIRVDDILGIQEEAGGELRYVRVTRHLTHLGLYTEISVEGTR